MTTSRRRLTLLILVVAIGLLAAARHRRITALELEFAERDRRPA